MSETYTTRNGFTLEYKEWGKRGGFPVLYLHGLLGGFPVNMASYAGPLRLVELKRSGYGRSSLMGLSRVADYADHIREFLDHLGLDAFCTLAHSAGAPFALALAAAYPQRVTAVGITSGVPECYKKDVIGAAPSPGMIRLFYLLCRLLPPGLSGRWFCGFVRKHVARHGEALRAMYPEDALEQIVSDALVNNGKGMAETARTQGAPWGFSMRDVSGKVFWHHSRNDEEVLYACAKVTWERLANAAVRTYESESHSAPVMFLDLLDELAAECAGARPGAEG